MPTPRSAHQATLLPNGTVFVAGPDPDAALYDPSTESWAATGSGIDGSVETATLLRDGTVLVVFNGRYASSRSSSAALYNPDTGFWTATASASRVVGTGAKALLLRDGTVLVAGGEYPGSVTSAWLYHPDGAP
jgi:hypothetical protein